MYMLSWFLFACTSSTYVQHSIDAHEIIHVIIIIFLRCLMIDTLNFHGLKYLTMRALKHRQNPGFNFRGHLAEAF